jgi:hypothetical protein
MRLRYVQAFKRRRSSIRAFRVGNLDKRFG